MKNKNPIIVIEHIRTDFNPAETLASVTVDLKLVTPARNIKELKEMIANQHLQDLGITDTISEIVDKHYPHFTI